MSTAPEYDVWFRAERLNPETRQWEYVGDADTEREALELRPANDWAEYRVRMMRGQG